MVKAGNDRAACLYLSASAGARNPRMSRADLLVVACAAHPSNLVLVDAQIAFGFQVGSARCCLAIEWDICLVRLVPRCSRRPVLLARLRTGVRRRELADAR